MTLIMELFSKDCASKIMHSIPDNIRSSATFEDVFKGAIVHFAHFEKMADNSVLYAMHGSYMLVLVFTENCQPFDSCAP